MQYKNNIYYLNIILKFKTFLRSQELRLKRTLT
jgi:hypothetical protein